MNDNIKLPSVNFGPHDPVLHPKFVGMLMYAKVRITIRQKGFVCSTTQQWAWQNDSLGAWFELVTCIRRSLYPHATLGGFVDKQYDLYYILGVHARDGYLSQLRVQWIDEMISQLQQMKE